MSAFIVSGGVLLEVGCPSSLDRATSQSVSVEPTLEGKVKALIRRGGRRSWSISVGLAAPSEVSTLEAVARQVGPYGWYDSAAVIGNLLSPQASSFEVTPAGAADAGLVGLPDGTVARTVTAEGTIRIGSAHGAYEMVPVRPGEPVTVGAWAVNGLGFQGNWRDASGNVITNYGVAAVAHSGWAWRETVLTPPVGAAFIEPQVLGGTQYALPSVAWGAVGRRELGTGCPLAVIHSPSFSPVALWDGANYTATSYSVVEIG